MEHDSVRGALRSPATKNPLYRNRSTINIFCRGGPQFICVGEILKKYEILDDNGKGMLNLRTSVM
jgi:hypothetical protein